MPRDWTDVMLDNLGKILLGLFILSSLFIWWGADISAKERAEFMTGCVQLHDQYECAALYGKAHPQSDTTILYMPMGR